MASDKIMVTVTVPEGKRVNVTTADADEYKLGYGPPMEFTVIGGTSQDFFVDEIRSLVITEGEPHSKGIDKGEWDE
jgi:hypothetical protein